MTFLQQIIFKLPCRFQASSMTGFHISMLEEFSPPITATTRNPDWSLRHAQELYRRSPISDAPSLL